MASAAHSRFQRYRLAALLAALVDTGYDGPVVIEIEDDTFDSRSPAGNAL
jgi:sugar phosphate isomerase/epimerase